MSQGSCARAERERGGDEPFPTADEVSERRLERDELAVCGAAISSDPSSVSTSS